MNLNEVFTRVIVGVDGTEAGFEACRQAARFAETGAAIEAVSAVHLVDAVHAGWNATQFADQMRRDAEAALDQAVAILGGGALRKFVNGHAADALLAEIRRSRATVLVIGAHGHHRATEIVFGGVAGDLLHRAPCSILIARPPLGGAQFPSSLVVGVDGSPSSGVALAVATRLARRFAVPLRVVAGLRDKHVDPERVRLLVPQADLLDLVDLSPVEALDVEAQRNDLLVVGSRGLAGLRALGSVSERVAHRARCSVLVVRTRKSR